MALRAGTAPSDGRRPEPLFTVLVGYETFHGRIRELANRAVVSPGALVPWLDQAWIERVVFDPESRVIDVGVARRLFSGATRRAVQVRDQECFHPLCDERPSFARSTTSSPGAPAATPWPPTGGRRVRITTGNGTDDRSRRSRGDGVAAAGFLDRSEVPCGDEVGPGLAGGERFADRVFDAVVDEEDVAPRER